MSPNLWCNLNCYMVFEQSITERYSMHLIIEKSSKFFVSSIDFVVYFLSYFINTKFMFNFPLFVLGVLKIINLRALQETCLHNFNHFIR